MERQRIDEANWITVVGLVMNVALTGIKLAAGVVAHSAAIIADAVHSLSDLSTDVALLWGLRAAARPVDADHHYGHGKTDTLVSVGIGIFLCLLAGGILWHSLLQIHDVMAGGRLAQPGIVVCFVAALSVASKEWLYRRTVAIAHKVHSQGMVANAWHHRTDAFSSVAVMLGVAGAIFLGEPWRVLDPIAAAAVSVFILHAGVTVTRAGIDELLEQALSEETQGEIFELCRSVQGVARPHKLRTRRIGHRVAIEIHICVAPTLSIIEAHNCATAVEEVLKGRFGPETFTSVHVEPLEA